MLEFITTLLAIQLWCVLITDVCGGDKFMKQVVSWIVTRGKLPTSDYSCKILECSQCQTFWLSVAYSIVWCCLNGFCVWCYVLTALNCAFVDATCSLVWKIHDLFVKLIRKI